jgi:ribosome biogenesis GTPase
MDRHEEWEQYFDPSRRQMRRERTMARRTDRSKYKVTDQLKARRAEPTTMGEDQLLLGKVIFIRSQDIVVATADRTYTCTLRGVFKLSKDRKKNLVVVGDNVRFDPITADTGCIHHILPRSSILCRQEHLHRVQQQLVASNVDQVLITVSLAEPSFRPSIVDRYRIAARKGGMAPIVAINKMDLADQYPKEADLVHQSLQLYESLGIPAVSFSAQTGEGMSDLEMVLKDRISVFSGQSGTGKSCIINALTGLTLKTASVRAVGKGAHTTTSAQLLPLPFGGWCVDTPGIRSFGIVSLEKEDLQAEFVELFAQPCRFNNCWHTQQEGCALPDALARGDVSPLRISSYLSLLASISSRYSS